MRSSAWGVGQDYDGEWGECAVRVSFDQGNAGDHHRGGFF